MSRIAPFQARRSPSFIGRTLRAAGAAAFVLVGPALSAQELGNSSAIDAYLDRAVAETKIPGLVALVVDEDGVLYSHTAGFSNVASSTPMSADTIFNIASMTKPIAVAAIMLLVEEGKLSLDDPISKYVPEFSDKPVITDFNAETGTYSTRPAAGACGMPASSIHPIATHMTPPDARNRIDCMAARVVPTGRCSISPKRV